MVKGPNINNRTLSDPFPRGHVFKQVLLSTHKSDAKWSLRNLRDVTEEQFVAERNDH